MNCLFYFYSCFNPTFMGMLMDEAIELAKSKENNVLFVYCGGVNSMCLFNRKGSQSLCKFCTCCTRKVLEDNNISCKSLEEYETDAKQINFHYSTASELRAIQYRDVNIGLSIMSGYISGCRNLAPKIDEVSHVYFNAHLNQNVKFVDALYNLVDNFSPDVFYTFNGRYEEVRPVFDICMAKNIKLCLSEGFIKEGKWQKLFYIDHLPHDIKYLVERRNYLWEHYPMSEEEKIALGKRFYYNRRHGIYAGDKIYVKDQTEGKIPVIDPSKMNIAIFNSSEDEYAAVGGDWDKIQFFPSQYDGIVYMLSHAEPNMHFYLRIHPNLKGITYKYHTDLLKLESQYNNVTVIPAESDVSTYTLLDKMDKVVCFGSTMGIESVYWGKPVILLAGGLYYYDDICYLPKNKEEFDIMLRSHLEPKTNESLVKYGAFSLDQDPLIFPNNNISFQIKSRKFFGRSYSIVPFVSFLINERITALYIAVGRTLYGLPIFNRYNVPTEEV